MRNSPNSAAGAAVIQGPLARANSIALFVIIEIVMVLMAIFGPSEWRWLWILLAIGWICGSLSVELLANRGLRRAAWRTTSKGTLEVILLRGIEVSVKSVGDGVDNQRFVPRGWIACTAKQITVYALQDHEVLLSRPIAQVSGVEALSLAGAASYPILRVSIDADARVEGIPIRVGIVGNLGISRAGASHLATRIRDLASTPDE